TAFLRRMASDSGFWIRDGTRERNGGTRRGNAKAAKDAKPTERNGLIKRGSAPNPGSSLAGPHAPLRSSQARRARLSRLCGSEHRNEYRVLVSSRRSG